MAGEVFLVPIRGRLADLQELFVLDDVGSWIWERLDGSRSVHDLATEVVGEFEVDHAQAAADLEVFLQQLREAGLTKEPPAPEA